MDRSLSVSAIEGVGPKTAGLLERVGIVSAFDLLRVSAQRLHPVVRSLASLAEVHAWRSAASLLQVQHMTPQWAEALVRSGVESVERLAREDLESLRTFFAEAQAHHIISGTPSPAECAAMMRDAAVLQHTGYLRGTVLDATNAPISGALVRISGEQAKTDGHGRFDLLRLPLGTVTSFSIEHPDYVPKVVGKPRLLRDPSAVSVQVFRLDADRSEAAGLRILSELDGDTLPPTAGLPVRVIWRKADALREHDILMARAYESGDDMVRLVSKLKVYVNGQIHVYAHRMPVATLPEEIRSGDHFRVRGGRLEKVVMGPERLQRYKIKRRLARSFENVPKPTTMEGLIERLKAQNAFLKQHGYFVIRRRPRHV